MAIEWTPNLTVGIDRIDDQHKMLYKKVNELFDACQQRKGKQVIGDILKFLDAYTKMHFSEEEKYMQSINYPGYAQHCIYHKEFIVEIEKLLKQFNESGNSLVVTLSVNNLVVNWLNQHISKEDAKIGTYISR